MINFKVDMIFDCCEINDSGQLKNLKLKVLTIHKIIWDQNCLDIVFDIKPLVEFTFFENNNTQKENLSVQYFFSFLQHELLC